ncbi:MAG: anthranilate phosphoribosyltransferase [Candidatus Obscuribacterales bacterium]|nr:anthranilate phosphoribosyltransferase [Candidatus Obscuribacterales bacterium]
MLTPEYIGKIINLELPEEELKENLIALTPEKLDVDTVHNFIETIRATCIEGIQQIDGNSFIDCSGTGGSGISRYNTSTAVAFVLSTAGLTVTKFGNHAVSSSSGSFDILEALGFSSNIPIAEIGNLIEETNLIFLFAPQAYPSLAKLAPLRKKLGIKTIFNYIGPLLNPFKPNYRLMGISDSTMQHIVSEYLSKHVQPKKALVVRAENNLDELCHYSPITLMEVVGGAKTETTYDASTLSNKKEADSSEALKPEEGAKALVKLFEGSDKSSDYYELVCLNAGAGLYAAERAGSIEEGRLQAQELLSNGLVMKKLDQLRRAYARINCTC